MEKTKSAKPKSTPRKNTTKEEKSKEVPKKVVNDEEKSKYKATIEKIWKENYKTIEVQALVSKAKKDRTIEELIDNKVNFEFNSLMYQIKQFNSKYNERRRSYADIKDELITLLKKYEKRLYEVSEWHETKQEGDNDRNMIYNYKKDGALGLGEYVSAKAFVEYYYINTKSVISSPYEVSNASGVELLTKDVYRTKTLVKEFK